MKSEPTYCRITVDLQAITWLEELTTQISAFSKLVPSPIELIDLVRQIPNRAAAFSLKSEPTGHANEHRIVLKPSDGLIRLMTALRAFNGGRHYVDSSGHIVPS